MVCIVDSTMEAEKLQRLYDTLEKLKPKGKYGGLGNGGLYAGMKKPKDNTLPNTPLYNNFVRPGAFHKRTFDENESKEENMLGDNGRNIKRFREDDKESGLSPELSEDEIRSRIKKEILKALKTGRDNRKNVEKSVQISLSNGLMKFKKVFKSVLNDLIEKDKVILHEDDTIERIEKVKKGKKR